MRVLKLPVSIENNVISSQKSLLFTVVQGIPEIKTGDNISNILIKLLEDQHIGVNDGDIFVVAQKIVSKAEGRYEALSKVKPSKQALKLELITKKDPRFIELVLRESKKVLRAKFNTLIVEHKKGFICANAGIDHSNIGIDGKESSDWVLLLPKDPDESARKIRLAVDEHFNKNVGVLIIDSHGRAWRNGTVGVAIGISGLPGLVDLRGREDMSGFKLRVTTVGAADELAAGASLLMGQAAEGTPVIHVKGFPYPLRESVLSEIIRPEEEDLFR